MHKPLRRACLVVLLFLVGACVHPDRREHQEAEAPVEPALTPMPSGNLVASAVLYLPAKMPLTDFFHKLSHFQLQDAFRSIDLEYVPSNASNAALKQLLREGYLPAYVEVRNTGDKSVIVSERSFNLIDEGIAIPAMNPVIVPTEFSHFNAAVVGADLLNATANVIGFAALVGVSAFGGDPCALGACDNKVNSPSSGIPTHNQSLTVTLPEKKPFGKKLTSIEFHSLLFSKVEVKPGAVAKGLLVFHVPSHHSSKPSLNFEPVDETDPGTAVLASDGLIENRDHTIRHLDYSDAEKTCPVGTHLPTIREMAILIRNRGGSGFCQSEGLHVSKVDAVGAAGGPDKFLFAYQGYHPQGRMGLNWFWTKSAVDGDSQANYVLDGINGDLLTNRKNDINVAVLCLPASCSEQNCRW